ncbi:hypothetical protein [Sphingopyxis flava]|uniref:Uncharacterized protein n=1 Tax=Sphingopyxis flava TaxID=1507287 RepID=A0A1T5CTY9_9SPHN|nr:hypothetical protein [Sphingopyxis flava]SKB62781.1 hypothetical protein SAMN06295937_1011105 [Sphingopyxis flava]
MTAEEFRKSNVDLLIAKGVERDQAERVLDIAMHSATEAYDSLTLNLNRLEHNGEFIVATGLACEILKFRLGLAIESIKDLVA